MRLKNYYKATEWPKSHAKQPKRDTKLLLRDLKGLQRHKTARKKTQIQKENNHKETINVHGERKIEHLKKMQNIHVEKDAKW